MIFFFHRNDKNIKSKVLQKCLITWEKNSVTGLSKQISVCTYGKVSISFCSSLIIIGEEHFDQIRLTASFSIESLWRLKWNKSTNLLRFHFKYRKITVTSIIIYLPSNEAAWAKRLNECVDLFWMDNWGLSSCQNIHINQFLLCECVQHIWSMHVVLSIWHIKMKWTIFIGKNC